MTGEEVIMVLCKSLDLDFDTASLTDAEKRIFLKLTGEGWAIDNVLLSFAALENRLNNDASLRRVQE